MLDTSHVPINFTVSVTLDVFVLPPIAIDLFPFLPPLIALPCSFSAHPFFFFSPAISPILSSQPFHHLLFAYLSPITLHPSLLHHSIFVLVQLQKWDLAVTNLLAKPPRAPCGGASSQRTRDWLNLGKTLSGWPSWLDLLPDNKFPPPSRTMGRHKCHVVHFHDTWCPGLLRLIHIARFYFLLFVQSRLSCRYMSLTLK